MDFPLWTAVSDMWTLSYSIFIAGSAETLAQFPNTLYDKVESTTTVLTSQSSRSSNHDYECVVVLDKNNAWPVNCSISWDLFKCCRLLKSCLFHVYSCKIQWCIIHVYVTIMYRSLVILFWFDLHWYKVVMEQDKITPLFNQYKTILYHLINVKL